MKKLYFLFAFIIMGISASAQCSVNGSAVPNEDDVSPTAANCPRIQQNVFYDQTVQGRVISSYDTTVTIPISISMHFRVDSIRIDDITGMPAGITWSKTPDVVRGGAAGCLRFSGTTSAIAGTYPITITGKAWLYRTSTPSFPIFPDGPDSTQGNLTRWSPYDGYYLVVNGAGITLVTNSTNVSCNGGSNGTASVTPSGGSNYTYEWNGGFPNMYDSAITGLNARTYTVTVTSGVASATATVTITEPTAVQAAATSSSSSGSNGTATAAAVGGTPGYTYKWNNNDTAATATGLAPGAYFVTVTDSKGCTATASTVVVAGSGGVSVTLSKTDISCFGGSNGSVTANATGGGTYTYAWSNNGGNVATITNLTAGTYTVTVTSNGSSATASINVTAPTALTVSATSTPSTGANGTADATATGGTPGYSYQWTGGLTGASLTGLAPGTYNVTVTDSRSCSATATTFVATGTSNFNLSITKADVTCFGQNNGLATAVVTGTGTPTYVWSNNQTAASISSLAPGNYSVTATLNGSTLSASVTISQPAVINAVASTTPSTGSNGSANVTVSGGTPPYTYSWSNGSITDTIKNLAPGTYTVIVSDSRSCTANATATVVVTGINDIEEAAYVVNVFPNPANNVVNIVAEVPSGDVGLRVLNLAGQVVYATHQNSVGSYKAAVDCTGFVAGVYVLELSTAKQLVRNRFIVAR